MDDWMTKIAEAMRQPKVSSKCQGCKAITGQSILGGAMVQVCGLERKPGACSGPYGWDEFWKEVEKE